MEAIIWIAGLFCIFIGYVIARIEFNKKLPAIKQKSNDAGFHDGYDRALEDAGEVRRAYNRLFGRPR